MGDDRFLWAVGISTAVVAVAAAAAVMLVMFPMIPLLGVAFFAVFGLVLGLTVLNSLLAQLPGDVTEQPSRTWLLPMVVTVVATLGSAAGVVVFVLAVF